MRISLVVSMIACLGLAACERGKPPSEQLRDSVEQTIEGVAKTTVSDGLEAGPFAPRDECSKLSGANEFRNALGLIIAKRDADGLMALTDPQVKLDFGGGFGHATLRERLDDPQYRLWEELGALLDLGCATNAEGDLILPWYFAQDMKVDDAFGAMLALGNKVPVRRAAADDGEVVEHVAWDTGDLVEGYSDEPFLKVRTRVGREGFVAREQLRSLVDYRLIARKGEGGWMIEVFIAGD